jgi:hypothetical protein
MTPLQFLHDYYKFNFMLLKIWLHELQKYLNIDSNEFYFKLLLY